ncbi:MAG: hypothetical protein ACRECH_13480 [Nitrososphaerales archaeon]
MSVEIQSQNAEKIDEAEERDEDAMNEASEFRGKVLGTKIPDRLHSKALDKAAKDGLTPSAYMRRLIVQDLRDKSRPKQLSEDMSRKDAKETESSLLDYLDELDLAKEEILEKLEEIRDRRAPAPKVDISAREALDCVMEELQHRELENYSTPFLKELKNSMTKNYGNEGKEALDELCDKLSKAYGENITPGSFLKTDFVSLAKKPKIENTV